MLHSIYTLTCIFLQLCELSSNTHTQIYILTHHRYRPLYALCVHGQGVAGNRCMHTPHQLCICVHFGCYIMLLPVKHWYFTQNSLSLYEFTIQYKHARVHQTSQTLLSSLVSVRILTSTSSSSLSAFASSYVGSPLPFTCCFFLFFSTSKSFVFFFHRSLFLFAYSHICLCICNEYIEW